MMMRNLFIREERQTIVIGGGIFPKWLQAGNRLRFGPTLTPAGRIAVSFNANGSELLVDIDTDAKDASFPLEIDVPGYSEQRVPNTSRQYVVRYLKRRTI